jgi:hypothetical protein
MREGKNGITGSAIIKIVIIRSLWYYRGVEVSGYAAGRLIGATQSSI